jgi:exodeoxyribonuclease VII small subunit
MNMKVIPVEKLSYEQAYQELESIVNLLENTPPDLEESLAYFERGQALSQRCSTLLEQAELKIRVLTGREPDAKEQEV